MDGIAARARVGVAVGLGLSPVALERSPRPNPSGDDAPPAKPARESAPARSRAEPENPSPQKSRIAENSHKSPLVPLPRRSPSGSCCPGPTLESRASRKAPLGCRDSSQENAAAPRAGPPRQAPHCSQQAPLGRRSAPPPPRSPRRTPRRPNRTKYNLPLQGITSQPSLSGETNFSLHRSIKHTLPAILKIYFMKCCELYCRRCVSLVFFSEITEPPLREQVLYFRGSLEKGPSLPFSAGKASLANPFEEYFAICF